jgi:homoserine O-acetyltransferase
MSATASIVNASQDIASLNEASLRLTPLQPLETRFEIIGARGAPVIAVLGGISASRHAASSASDHLPGWWEDVVGAERAIDTAQFRVISIDYVTNDVGKAPVTTADQADALAAALDRAGIRCLHAVVGASYGGMVALAFGVRYPRRARRLIVISAAHESDPMATALRHLQRRVVELGSAVGRERDGLAIARGIAMTSYLTARHFEEHIAPGDLNDPLRVEDRIGTYLKTRGDQFAEHWTSERYNALSLSLDLHSVRPEEITTPTTVIAVSSDRLVPITHSRELAARLGGPSQLIELDSSLGHDAFLGDSSRIAAFINELLGLGTEVTS